MTRLPVLAALLLPAPALALTPEELWSEWQAQAAGLGFTLSAEAEAGADGSLTLRNWAAGPEGLPPQPLPAEGPVQEVRLSPAADGAVSIDLGLGESMVLPGADPAYGDLRFDQRGLSVTASEGEDGTLYRVEAESLRLVSLGGLDAASTEAFAGEVVDVSLSFPGGAGADRTAEVALAFDGFAYVVDRTDPFAGEPSSQAVRSEGTAEVTAALTLPEGMALLEMDSPADFALALEQGLALRLEGSSGLTTQSDRFDGWPFSYSYVAVTEPGTASLIIDRSGIVAGGEFGGGSVRGQSPQLPFPELTVSYGPLQGALRVPMGPEPGELHYLLSLSDLTLDDVAWDMIDRQGLLPREPASLTLDLGGQLAFDLAGMLRAEEAGEVPTMPELLSLELRQFELALAGLSATTTGSLTFDEGAWGPEPQAGTATARIEGLDRLLDALVGMGWIDEQQAREARFGLALVFRPGGAPDTRETTIELREGGQVFANGIQIQ